MGPKLSVIGLWNYDNTLFDTMQLPEGISMETVRLAIFHEAADFNVVYPDPQILKSMIGAWSAHRVAIWTRLKAVAEAQYDMLNNYDRKETESIGREEEHSIQTSQTTNTEESQTGTDTTAQSGTDSTSQGGTVHNTGSDTGSKTAFDSNTLQVTDKEEAASTETRNLTDTRTLDLENERSLDLSTTRSARGSGTDSGTRSEDVTRTLRSYGNIGVTSSQQLLEQEIQLSYKIDLVNIIAVDFVENFCVEVY